MTMTKTSDEEPVMTRAAAAAQWTRTYLKAHEGRATSRDLYAAGRHAGYRESTLQSARKTTEDIIIVKEGRSWVWRLATPEEAKAVAAAHAAAPKTTEERWRNRTQPYRTVITHWPCKGLSRFVMEVLDPSAPGGIARSTSWVKGAPTNCNSQANATEGEAA